LCRHRCRARTAAFFSNAAMLGWPPKHDCNHTHAAAQESRIVRVIRKQLTRRSLELIEGLAGKEGGEDYKTFWENFGRNLKVRAGCVCACACWGGVVVGCWTCRLSFCEASACDACRAARVVALCPLHHTPRSSCRHSPRQHADARNTTVTPPSHHRHTTVTPPSHYRHTPHTVTQIGVIEDQENRERLSKLLRFYSSKESGDSMVGLEAYVGRMKEGQKGIYYMVSVTRQV
jgi:hypothetical protein